MTITNGNDHENDQSTDYNDEAALNNLLCTDEIEYIHTIYSPNHRNRYRNRNRNRNRNNRRRRSNTTTTNTTTTNGNSNGTTNNNNNSTAPTTTTTTTTPATTPAIVTLAQGHYHAAEIVTDHPYGSL